MAGVIVDPEVVAFESEDAVRAYLLKLRTDDLVYGAVRDLGQIELSAARKIVAEELASFVAQAKHSKANNKKRIAVVKA